MPPINPKGLDLAITDIIANNCASGQTPPSCLPTQAEKSNYVALNSELKATQDSASPQKSCQAKGDGNLDMRVNQTDIANWQVFDGKGPSRYDINLDGQTDEADLAIIQASVANGPNGLDCLDICKRADLNRDGKVNAADMTLMNQQTGTCTDQIFCGGDLNGDGVVNNPDVTIMIGAQQTCGGNLIRKWRERRANR